MNPVIKLEHTFDHATLLNEFVLCQPNQTLPVQYTTMEVFNGAYTQNIVEKCPYTISVCEQISQLNLKYNFVLFRLMQPHTTLSWHMDIDCEYISYHIPVITNHACFYAYDDRLFSMHELGHLYSVRVDDMHTFVNAGSTARLHLHFIYDKTGRYTRREFLG